LADRRAVADQTAQDGRGLAIAGLAASAGWSARVVALAHSHVI